MQIYCNDYFICISLCTLTRSTSNLITDLKKKIKMYRDELMHIKHVPTLKLELTPTQHC